MKAGGDSKDLFDNLKKCIDDSAAFHNVHCSSPNNNSCGIEIYGAKGKGTLTVPIGCDLEEVPSGTDWMKDPDVADINNANYSRTVMICGTNDCNKVNKDFYPSSGVTNETIQEAHTANKSGALGQTVSAPLAFAGAAAMAFAACL